MKQIATVAAVLLLLSACGGEASEDEIESSYEQAREGLSEATFEDVGDTADCTEDCSGHEAGFEWAKEEGVTDISECGGDSDSFVEGCEAYASAVDESAEDFESQY